MSFLANLLLGNSSNPVYGQSSPAVLSGQQQATPVGQANPLSGLMGGGTQSGGGDFLKNLIPMLLLSYGSNGNPQVLMNAIKMRDQKKQSAAEQQRKQQRSALTAKWLEAQGAPPEIIGMAKQGYADDAIKFYQQQTGKASEENWGVNPQLVGRDKDGDGQPDEYRYMQFGNRGNVRGTEMPEGLDEFRPIDPYTKKFLGSRGAVEGREQGEKRAAFPTKTLEAQKLIGEINELYSHPGKSKSLGMIEGNLWNFRADPNVADFRERVKQIQGGAFLQARQALKGGGAITDYEGDRAAQALIRAEQAKTEAQFDKALDDFKNHVIGMYEAYAKEAGLEAENVNPGAPQSNIPSPGGGLPDMKNMTDEQLQAIINGG